MSATVIPFETQPAANPRGGPNTEAGKAISASNSTKHGLFAAHDFIRPGEEPLYNELTDSLDAELNPRGPLERNLVAEIRRAMWRLRRCGEVEAHLVVGLDNGSGFIFDPMETSNSEAAKVQLSVDRARSQAHRLLHKCTAELRKLQAERKSAEASSFCKTPNPLEPASPQTPRNADCPCQSGLKYKRCCGKDAPAVLHAV